MRKLAGFVFALACACAPRGSAQGDIALGDHAFSPARITVSAGAEVTWVNDSGQAHTVTAYEDSLPEGAPYFASGGAPSEEAARADLSAGLIRPGETFSVTFEVPGTYRYFCIPHEGQGMTGTVVVEG